MNFARFIIFCFANICILCSETTNKIYVTLQGINKVGILYDDTMDTSTIDIDYGLDGEAGQDSPHFIVIDKIKHTLGECWTNCTLTNILINLSALNHTPLRTLINGECCAIL